MRLVPLPKNRLLREKPRGLKIHLPEMDPTDSPPPRISGQCHVRLTHRQAVAASVLERRLRASEVCRRGGHRVVNSTGAAVGEVLDRLADELGIDESGRNLRKEG